MTLAGVQALGLLASRGLLAVAQLLVATVDGVEVYEVPP